VRGWLLDTNVISELRKAKPDAGVLAFMEAQPGDLLYVSEIVLHFSASLQIAIL
jgi:hypothetical protein